MYIKVDKELSREPENCVFCKHLKGGEFLKESKHFFVVQNDYPYMEQHMLLLPKRHVHSELDFTDDEAWDFIGINRDLIQAYKKMFDSAFVLTRENTPGQTQWHWHRHFMPHEKTVIPEAPRVPFVAILKELL